MSQERYLDRTIHGSGVPWQRLSFSVPTRTKWLKGENGKAEKKFEIEDRRWVGMAQRLFFIWTPAKSDSRPTKRDNRERQEREEGGWLRTR